MMAACDLLMMPSRYEPCGLPQMYSQMPEPQLLLQFLCFYVILDESSILFLNAEESQKRYGTLPVVHATGGLVDSVKDISSGIETATGFHARRATPFLSFCLYFLRFLNVHCP